MKSLILSVFFFVVCSVQAQRISLPVGETAVTEWQWSHGLRAEIFLQSVDRGAYGSVIVDNPKNLDSIKDSVDRMEIFDHTSLDGHYFVEVSVISLPDNKGKTSAIMRFTNSTPFQIKKEGGKFVLPPEAKQFASATDLACTAPWFEYQSSINLPTTEVVWVEEGITYPGMVLEPKITHNGWGTNCWAYALYGNGVVYLDGAFLSGRQLKFYQSVDGPEVGQYITLWYDEGRTVGDKWDIQTGKWTPIGYGEVISPTSPVASADNLKTVFRFTSGTLGIATTGATPGGLYTLESSDSIGGSTSPVTTLSATDSGELYWYVHVDAAPAKFFNVRVARTGDPAPQKAVQSGFSIP